MEFCGGHTHAIFRYGVHGFDAGERRICARPRLPGLRAARRPHRECDRTRRAARRHPLQLWRHAAGARSEAASLLKAKAEGADIRMVYSIDDALKSLAKIRARGRVFHHRLRDDHAANRRRHPEGARRRPQELHRVLQPCADARRDESHPGNARRERGRSIDAFLGPSHVSAVIGSEPYEYFAKNIGGRS